MSFRRRSAALRSIGLSVLVVGLLVTEPLSLGVSVEHHTAWSVLPESMHWPDKMPVFDCSRTTKGHLSDPIAIFESLRMLLHSNLWLVTLRYSEADCCAKSDGKVVQVRVEHEERRGVSRRPACRLYACRSVFCPSISHTGNTRGASSHPVPPCNVPGLSHVQPPCCGNPRAVPRHFPRPQSAVMLTFVARPWRR